MALTLGVWYGRSGLNQDVFKITTPTVNFTLTQINPIDTTLLRCLHVENGQIYTCASTGMTVAGQVVSFPAKSFDYVFLGQPATLIFEQIRGFIYRTTH